MVRETKEARRAREAAEQVILEAEKKAAKESYTAALPKRIFEAQALASSLGVSVETSMTATGPRVDFWQDSDGVFIRTSLTYETTEWEILQLEQELKLIKHAQDLQAARLQFARVAFDKLSREEQESVKEFIHYMKVKPN